MGYTQIENRYGFPIFAVFCGSGRLQPIELPQEIPK